MIAPFAHFLRALAQSPSLRLIILAIAALYDAHFSISDLRHTIAAHSPPACDGRATLLNHYSAISTSSLHLQSLARYSTSRR